MGYGKMITIWASESSLNKLHEIFAHFNAQYSWKALLHAMDLFRDISRQTAQKFSFEYSEDLDYNLSNFILNRCEK